MKSGRLFLPSIGVIAAILLPAVVLLISAGGCGHDSAKSPTVQLASTTEKRPEFVGNEACKECHQKEFSQHHSSRHDTTLRLVSKSELGPLAPTAGPIPGTIYSIEYKGEDLYFSTKTGSKPSKQIQLAFGSGVSGMTFAGDINTEGFTEFRNSHLPGMHKWYITPGQEGNADLDLGALHKKEMAKNCVLCHAVTLPTNSYKPEQKFLGVGCEACHGAGSQHIAAARTKGATDLKVEKIGKWGASKINALCGRCHRNAEDVPLVTRDATATHRFQPYGLEMSPCFKKSGDKLSCLTCHDAHTNVSHDQASYVKTCLSCHSPAHPEQKPCPVNPRDKCIGCHMPSRQLLPGSQIPITMSDHLIWANRPTRRASK